MNHISAGPGLIRTAGRNGTVLTPYSRPKSVRRFPSPLRTFFTTDASEGTAYKVKVTAGAINNVTKIEGIYDVTNGDVVYIHATTDGSGSVTAVSVGVAAEIPEDDELNGYTLLATCSVSESLLTVTPVAWNYSQMQKCGATTYLWGGFGE